MRSCLSTRKFSGFFIAKNAFGSFPEFGLNRRQDTELIGNLPHTELRNEPNSSPCYLGFVISLR
jgi:hypothetical protein